jgi:hypothetical protein
MLRRRASGYACHVHSEMPAPGVQDFRLIAPLQFMNCHARASLTRASISPAKESA